MQDHGVSHFYENIYYVSCKCNMQAMWRHLANNDDVTLEMSN